MNLYCDIIRQRFAQGFRFDTEIKPVLTQNDSDWQKLYLVVPNRDGGRFPFVYDENSGKPGITATVALSNPGGTPLTLVAPVSFDNIVNGFSGILPLDTQEIASFLTGRAERDCAFSVEVTDVDGNRLTSFFSYVVLRAASTEAETVSIPGVIRRRDITAYTGGTPTDLEGIVTAGKNLGTIWWVKINGAESHWELVAQTTPTDPVVPSDPDAGHILTVDGGQLVRTIGV